MVDAEEWVRRVTECLVTCKWSEADSVVREFLEWADTHICERLRELGYMCYRDMVEAGGEGRAEAEFEALLDRIYSLPYGLAVMKTLNATRVLFECLRAYEKRDRDYKLYAVDRAVYALEKGLPEMSRWAGYYPRPRLSRGFRYRVARELPRLLWDK